MRFPDYIAIGVLIFLCVGCRRPVTARQVVVVARRCCVCAGISLDLVAREKFLSH
jgi:hypothetical protein